MKLRDRMVNNNEEERVSLGFSTIQSTINMMNQNLTELNETLKNITTKILEFGVYRDLFFFSFFGQSIK